MTIALQLKQLEQNFLNAMQDHLDPYASESLGLGAKSKSQWLEEARRKFIELRQQMGFDILDKDSIDDLSNEQKGYLPARIEDYVKFIQNNFLAQLRKMQLGGEPSQSTAFIKNYTETVVKLLKSLEDMHRACRIAKKRRYVNHSLLGENPSTTNRDSFAYWNPYSPFGFNGPFVDNRVEVGFSQISGISTNLSNANHAAAQVGSAVIQSGEAVVHAISIGAADLKHSIPAVVQAAPHAAAEVGGAVIRSAGAVGHEIGHVADAAVHVVGHAAGGLAHVAAGGCCRGGCGFDDIKILGGVGGGGAMVGTAMASGGSAAPATPAPAPQPPQSQPLQPPAHAAQPNHVIVAKTAPHATHHAAVSGTGKSGATAGHVISATSKIGIAAGVVGIIYAAVLAPAIIKGFLTDCKNIYRGYKRKRSAGRFTARGVGFAIGFLVGWFVPFGGPITALGLGMFGAWVGQKTAKWWTQRVARKNFDSAIDEAQLTKAAAVSDEANEHVNNVRNSMRNGCSNPQKYLLSSAEYQNLNAKGITPNTAQAICSRLEAVARVEKKPLGKCAAIADHFSFGYYKKHYCQTERRKNALAALKLLKKGDDVNEVRNKLIQLDSNDLAQMIPIPRM